MNEMRKPLYEYLRATRDTERVYVFTSQRSERLTEEGIHLLVPHPQGLLHEGAVEIHS